MPRPPLWFPLLAFLAGSPLLAGCDVVLGGADFEATVSGARTASFSGNGRVDYFNDVAFTIYGLQMRDEDRLHLSIWRQVVAPPEPGVYDLRPGLPDDLREFATDAVLYEGTTALPFYLDAGTLTVEACGTGTVRGRFEMTGTMDGTRTTLTGSFALPREDERLRPLPVCS